MFSLFQLFTGVYAVRVSVKAQQAYGESAVNFTVHPGITSPPLDHNLILFAKHTVSTRALYVNRLTFHSAAVDINKPPKAVTLPKSQDVLLQEGSIFIINGSRM